MILPKFDYQAPASITQACSLLAEADGQATLMAGGTDLLVQMKQGTLSPALVVGLRKMPELQGLSHSETEGLRIGAMVNLKTLISSPLVTNHFSLLGLAASLVGAAQHRSMGTAGGNLCLDTRCLFYNQAANWRQSLAPCLKLGGDACHTVEGAQKCYAVYAADVGSALYALEGSVAVQGRRGGRVIPLEDFFTGDPAKPVSLHRDELITEIIVPPQRPSFARYYKMRPRGALDFAQVGVILVAFPEKKEYRVVLSAVAGKPLRFKDLEGLLAGQKLSARLVDDFAAAVSARVKPLANVTGAPAYRRKSVAIMLKKAFADMGVVQ